MTGVEDRRNPPMVCALCETEILRTEVGVRYEQADAHIECAYVRLKKAYEELAAEMRQNARKESERATSEVQATG